MKKEDKKIVIDELKDTFSKTSLIAVADFAGINVESITAFRKSVRAAKGNYRVTRNTLFRLASVGTPFENYFKSLKGSSGVVFGFDDPVGVAKAVEKFQSDNEKFKLKSVIFEGKEIGKSELKALSSLPSKEVLVAQLLGVLNGPMRGFVTVLSAVPRSFVTVLDAIAKKKEA